jgi:hypothetical protein
MLLFVFIHKPYKRVIFIFLITKILSKLQKALHFFKNLNDQKVISLIKSNKFEYLLLFLFAGLITFFVTHNIDLISLIILTALMLSFSFYKLELIKLISHKPNIMNLFLLSLFVVSLNFLFFYFLGSEGWYIVIITLFALLTIFFNFNYRLIIFAALFCLLICPILLFFKMNIIAGQIAIWVYILLITGVISALIDIIKNPQEWDE